MSIFGGTMGYMEFFHLLNRGVDKRKVFLDEVDYVRFLHDCYVFNDTADVNPNHRLRGGSGAEGEHIRTPLVALHAFALMPNHYHMLVSELEEGGMSLFMRKLNMGYAKYFNKKYERSGVLWQGTFKKVLIQRDAHFMYIPYYIHLNPLDMAFPLWRTGRIQNTKKALNYLQKYRWSSFMDYNKIPNMPSLITQKHLGPILDSPKNQAREIKRIISNSTLTQQADLLEG